MATVYILYSESIDTFYIGSCFDTKERLKQHNNGEFNSAFTKRANDWCVYLQIDNLMYEQARKIEKHIKRMKSRIYIHNLKKHSSIMNNLISRYS